jgi:hypothetical protein
MGVNSLSALNPGLSRLLKNELERNSAFFRFLLPEAEVDFREGPI